VAAREHAGFLSVRDFDGLEEAGFSALSVCLRAPECDLTIDTVQLGEPKGHHLDSHSHQGGQSARDRGLSEAGGRRSVLPP
jgi:hypothetical protein